MAGSSLSRMSLTGHVVQDQHHLQIQGQIKIILVDRVREMLSTAFDVCLFVYLYFWGLFYLRLGSLISNIIIIITIEADVLEMLQLNVLI